MANFRSLGPHCFVVLAKRKGKMAWCRRSMGQIYFCGHCKVWEFRCRPGRLPRYILPVSECPVCKAEFFVVVAPEHIRTEKEANNWTEVTAKKAFRFAQKGLKRAGTVIAVAEKGEGERPWSIVEEATGRVVAQYKNREMAKMKAQDYNRWTPSYKWEPQRRDGSTEDAGPKDNREGTQGHAPSPEGGAA